MINYFYDCYRILNKVYSEKSFIKQAITSTDIEEKNRAFTVKTCYGVLDKDIELSYYIKIFAEKSPKLSIRTILKIGMYDIKYLGKKEYAVIDNAVELVKKLGKKGASGFVNAFLRKFAKERDDVKLPGNVEEYLSVKYSYPLFAVKELLKVYGRERTEQIISAENQTTTLVFYDVDGEKYLTERNINFEKTPYKNVFSTKNFIRNADYDKGVYTYQALGSVAICEAVEKGEKLLDCCSAPGGKSIRLSYKFNQVTSWDIHEHRVNLIKEYASRMKRRNVYPMVNDAKEYQSNFSENFDAVLVDAPCSGLGVLNDNPDIKLNRTYDDVLSLIKEQTAILDTVSKYVKVGGYLYYSTCSVLDCENIKVVNDFLSKHPEYQSEKLTSELSYEQKGDAVAFLPDISGGLGFFIAKLKRVK